MMTVVDTREAARLYGCSTNHLRKVLSEEGVAHAGLRTNPCGSPSKLWYIHEVLKARATRAKRLAENKRKFAMLNHQQAVRASRKRAVVLGKHTRLERERAKWQARAAARKAQATQ